MKSARAAPPTMTTSVTWMLPDKLGGVYSFVGGMLAHRHPDSIDYHAILGRNLTDADDPSDADLRAQISRVVFRLPPENLHSVLRRISRQVVPGRGVIVANDWVSLATAAAHRTGKAVVYINHGDFDHYYDLAVMHEPTIDLYITYTSRMYQRLCELLPHRVDDIRCIPYGVTIPAGRRRREPDALRLLYVGRLDRSKGVMDLPLIAMALDDAGVPVTWTIQGPGPAEKELRDAWGAASHVTWTGRTSMDHLMEQYFQHDVLVMPSRGEGLPVALLEAMASGCVPVVSNLPSGIPELVENGDTGYRIEPGDVRGFAQAITSLSADRSALAAMSERARMRVDSEYNVDRRAPEYQQVIASASAVAPRWSGPRMYYGSRLDRAWIPNAVVKGARSLRRSIEHMRSVSRRK